jgi:hypothetical protein
MKLLLRAVFAAAILSAVFSASGGAVPGPQFHGIAFTKGCQSPTTIGQPYLCAYQITNNSDTAHDTLTFNAIVDQVHAFGGNVSAGNILPSLTVHASGGASCDNTPVNGTGTGNTFCTLPFNGAITTDFFSQYSPTGADWANLPGHVLTDTADLSWGDTCVPSDGTDPSSNCTVSSPADTLGAQAESQSLIDQLPSSTATTIHDAAHNPVTAVAAGSTVHDLVTVTGQPGSPVPTGNVTIDWFLNGTCAGAPAANSGPVGPLDAAGQFDATGFSFTVNSPGQRSFLAHYPGDGTYLPSDGVCEPLAVVDANIQITPNGTNPVGATHTFTAHVNVNDGSGFTNAPDGTQISFTIDSGPGSFTSANPCTTAGGTGSCTITLTSATPGTTVVSAHVTLSVGGVSLTRNTNGAGANSGPATKLWADDVVSTTVRDAAGADVTNTTVPAGTVVHDEATVAKAAGTPASVPDPTGTVDFTLYDNGTCNGNVVATDPGEPLVGGTATSADFTTPAAGGTFSYLAHYNGDANYPAHDGPCEPFMVQSVPQGQITPTNVDCSDILNGTAPTLAQVNYRVRNGTIFQSINPGKFFFWTKITTTVPNQVVTVTQSNTSTNNAALFQIHQGWDRVYAGDCSSWKAGTEINGGSGATFTIPTPGSYIIGIKYDPKSIAGTTAPVPDDITYDFTTSLGGSTGASVLLKQQ